MLNYLQIKFSPQSKAPIPFGHLYLNATSQPMPKQLSEVMDKVKETFFIGTIDEESLKGYKTSYDLEQPVEGKYQTMMVFAVEIKNGESLTRSELATLTRGFNRMASSLPVILFVKNGDRLSLATCERSEYRQQWRDGEKLGKVSILRDINLTHPHRGHLDILETLGEKAYTTFDDLYKHWLDVFSSELLTKKFYTELSEWYAWVIGSGKVKFPNDIRTTEDDTKYNHEAVIRLITRLIFVWFLKQKKLVPEEFFDEKAIGENFIENFDPHSTNTLFYNPDNSKYYRLILQNLFFAMLNRPIKDDETGETGNRRFRKQQRYRGGSFNEEFNINNLLRYQSEFKAGGDTKIIEIANNCIPFLNGGLFECLDHKDKTDPEYGMYYDGFTENPVARKQLSVPDNFFFTNDEGVEVDLSKWYDDKKKSHSKVRGLINILHRYNFTVEENTPLDQEVSLDPELLGKVFENLLAAVNPETNKTARKQTGSFYTPRPIVQYMVNESLLAYLKKTCPTIKEERLKCLLDFSDKNFEYTDEERKQLILALYSAKVLDPACGSGAFPMGILQQMVYVLCKLDPTNEWWKEFILEIAVGKDKEAYKDSKDKKELEARRRDIEEAFNRSVNDPDYARKLYIIENCIYGVDIQPIAAQISKLRFFISLVAEQKSTSDPISNFSIRPLPNLEAKIVAANSLIPLGQGNLFTETDEIIQLKKGLAEANHKLFIAKKNTEKRKLKNKIREIRKAYTDKLLYLGAVDDDNAMKLANWDMFDQNNYAKFFEPQWMFGISEGFDIVIGNPPYVVVAKNDPLKSNYDQNYEVAGGGKRNLYHLFFERGLRILKKGGVLSFITPDTFLAGNDTANLRKFFKKFTRIQSIILYSEKDKVFENVSQAVAVSVMLRGLAFDDFIIVVNNQPKIITIKDISTDPKIRFRWSNKAICRIKETKHKIDDFFYGSQGDINLTTKKEYFGCEHKTNSLPLVRGNQISPYYYAGSEEWCTKSALNKDLSNLERIVFQEVANAMLLRRVKATILKEVIIGHSANYLYPKNSVLDIYAALGIINSKVVNFYFKFYNQTNHVPIGDIKQIPFPEISVEISDYLSRLSKAALMTKKEDKNVDISDIENKIDMVVYHLYNLTYDELLIIDPNPPFSKEEYQILQI